MSPTHNQALYAMKTVSQRIAQKETRRNMAICDLMVNAQLSLSSAKRVVTAIESGEIPHIRVEYTA